MLNKQTGYYPGKKYTKQQMGVFLKDFRKFCPEFLKIKNKKANVVFFHLNKSQQIVLAIIERLIQLGVPVRLIILKARQKGISTLIEAYIFWRTAYGKNKKSAIISHEGDATDNMWEMQNRYYDNLPEAMQPQKKYHNAKELTFAKTNSEIKFWTAEKGDVGSSHTIQYAHLTELAKWRDPKTTLTAFLQTIPDDPETFNCIESTAKGFGGEFHDKWVLSKTTFSTAVQDILGFVKKDIIGPTEIYDLVDKWLANKKGEGNYIPIFLPWFIDDEYSMPFESEAEEQEFRKSLNELEIEILKKGATLQHLKYRREKLMPDKCGNDPNMFKQEYPSDDIECFLMSGRPVFDAVICNEKYNRKVEPLRIGNLEPVYNHTSEYFQAINSERSSYYDLLPYLQDVKFVENPSGYIKIFEELRIEPNEYYRFSVGSDCSEGLEQSDRFGMKVLDRKNMLTGKKLSFPITWHGLIGMDEFAVEQHKMQVFLKNKVYFATEKNNTGHAVIISAHKLKLKQYYAEDYRKGYETSTDTIGFRTTGTANGGGTKPEVINTLNEWIREDYFEDLDKSFWEETLTFVRDSKGRMAAQDKLKNPGIRCFDDLIICTALSLRCHLWMPNYYVKPIDKRPQWVKEREKKINDYSAMGV